MTAPYVYDDDPAVIARANADALDDIADLLRPLYDTLDAPSAAIVRAAIVKLRTMAAESRDMADTDDMTATWRSCVNDDEDNTRLACCDNDDEDDDEDDDTAKAVDPLS